MNYFIIALKLIVSFSDLNIYLVRFGKSTPWRGANTDSMKEEFQAYGVSQNG